MSNEPVNAIVSLRADPVILGYHKGAQKALADIQALVVDSQESADRAGLISADASAIVKCIEGAIKPVKQGLDAQKKLVLAFEAEMVNPAEKVKAVAVQKVRDWRDAENLKRQEAAREEEKRRLAQAEAERLAMGERMEARGANKQTVDAVLSLPLDVDPVKVEAPKVAGMTFAKTWVAEVVDEKLVPREWLVVDLQGLQRYARTMKERANVPGVRFTQKEKEPGARASAGTIGQTRRYPAELAPPDASAFAEEE